MPCLRHGPDTGPLVVFVAPLFEEANRLRRTLAGVMRALARDGVASALPDLPGQNDSPVATHAVTLADWRAALAAFVAAQRRPVVVASLRGGALIDDAASAACGWWRLSPATGTAQLRAMFRARIASDREAGVHHDTAALWAMAERDGALTLMGTRLSLPLLRELDAAEVAAVTPLRTRTLGADPGALPGAALWLRAEPGSDATLEATMAADLANWTRACAAR